MARAGALGLALQRFTGSPRSWLFHVLLAGEIVSEGFSTIVLGVAPGKAVAAAKVTCACIVNWVYVPVLVQRFDTKVNVRYGTSNHWVASADGDRQQSGSCRYAASPFP